MLKRTLMCGQPRAEHLGQEIVLSGWVGNRRDHGGVIFVDLRDRSGIVQVVFRPEADAELHQRAGQLRNEYCISVRGRVERRPPEMENPDLATGEIEMLAQELEVHAASETPPFEVQKEAEVSTEVRLRYRYLDMRRAEMQRNLYSRHRMMQTARRYLDEKGFVEVETPFLTQSTPEGARDYLVPSRVNPGRFYALPQSPQLFKQLLMIGGVDRYFQIVKCFRDEDLRANRQPEFTQIDLEMSFVDQDDVMALTEGLMVRLFKEILDRDLTAPLPRMQYADAFARYGTDAPDLRFGLEIGDVSDIAEDCDFRVFKSAVQSGGQVRGIAVPDGADMPRSQVDGLVEWIKQFGAGGLAWFKMRGGQAEGGVAKFFSEAEIAAVCQRLGVADGGLALLVADRRQVCNLALSHLRQRVARDRGMVPDDTYALCWVIEAPAFEHDEVSGRLTFAHHPFTAPIAEEADRLESDPTSVRTRSYDLVLNGQEIAGGSIRISDPELQMQILKILGYTQEEVEERFGFFMRALHYGAPPHGGIAFGFDRTVMTMLGLEDIRDTIAFPKTQKAICLLSGAPSPVVADQLQELGLSVDAETD